MKSLALLTALVGAFGTVACAGKIPPEQRARLAVVRSVRFGPDSGAPSQVRNDCRLGEELLEELADETRRYITIRLVGDHSGVPGRVLAMRFTRVEGVGSNESGASSITLIGRLLEDGEVIGAFTAQRSSEQSGDTCEVLGRIVDVLADDVAGWLRNPTPDAILGGL
ncbi:hypothetical protein [Nannocystis pusilla]|uniref:Lipoprotein n=1 Tax=Nannocystis pusilla TaxID=889268 RepID=A0ABS7TN29_9BACT|nr:hypothetical protein [Nannocystis pusilla]MBZ5709635.1 hypothetical protein [Nannocystis pusilla]